MVGAEEGEAQHGRAVLMSLPVIRVEPGRFDAVVAEAISALFHSPLLRVGWEFDNVPARITTISEYETPREVGLDEALTIAARWEGLHTSPPTRVIQAVQALLNKRGPTTRLRVTTAERGEELL